MIPARISQRTTGTARPGWVASMTASTRRAQAIRATAVRRDRNATAVPYQTKYIVTCGPNWGPARRAAPPASAPAATRMGTSAVGENTTGHRAPIAARTRTAAEIAAMAAKW